MKRPPPSDHAMDTRHRLCIKFAIVVNVLSLFLQSDRRFVCAAFLLKCPIHQMHLQKIVGFRPSLEYLTESNRIYALEGGHRNRLNPDEVDNGKNIERSDDETITSRICWGLCKEDDDCMSYVHLLDTNECYGFSHFDTTHRYLKIHTDLQMVADPEAIYFEKTCLKIPEMCKSRLWILTRIPGTSLVFQGKKTIPTLVTRRECAEACLFEKEFQCLSASFAPSYRNNRERFGQQVAAAHTRGETLGRCILSDKDKTIQSDSFRAAPFDEEYIENQCVERLAENDTCSFELYSNSSFVYAEAQYIGLTQKECQSYCSQESKFHCLGITFSSESGDYPSRSRCWLHSEDIISMGPRSLKLKANSVYMRKVKCLDVQVVCSPEQMTIKYTPKDWFRGKMYVSAHSADCVVDGNGTGSTLLTLPIGSEAKENRCGILRAYEVTKQYQRIFISALIVIQNNANVQTQGDRLIKVGCIINNDLSASDQNETDTQEKSLEDVPNAIALESSFEFSQEALPVEGSALFNISEQTFVPKISLQILDLSHKRKQETNDVQIGQNLELQIVAQTPQQLELAAPALYDIRATSLQAKTKDNQNYVLLIDEHGCPTDVTVFPALERVRTDSRNILRARFHAFKFAGSPLVGFDVKIHFCPHRCAEMNCQQNDGEVKGFSENWARQRRQTFYQDGRVQIKTPVYISSVMDGPQIPDRHIATDGVLNYSEAAVSRADFALPLNFSLHVRGPEVSDSNGFIYGERGILLIADTDDQLHSGGIYINQSLLIALFIFWLCIQTTLMFGCCYVIQKYKRVASAEYERRKIHESLEYLDGRRVRWADSPGGYTL